MTEKRNKDLASSDRRHFGKLRKNAKKGLTRKELRFLNMGVTLANIKLEDRG